LKSGAEKICSPAFLRGQITGCAFNTNDNETVLPEVAVQLRWGQNKKKWNAEEWKVKVPAVSR
jgi:hypothetical protein